MEKIAPPLPPQEWRVRWTCLAIFSLALGFDEVCTGEAWNLPSEGTGLGFWLVSPVHWRWPIFNWRCTHPLTWPDTSSLLHLHHHHHHQSMNTRACSLVCSREMAGLAGGAARRRRERQLCSFLRHEELSVKMALARALHHSVQRVEAPREWSREERSAYGYRSLHSREAAGSPAGARAAGEGSNGRSRGCTGASLLHRCWRTLHGETPPPRRT